MLDLQPRQEVEVGVEASMIRLGAIFGCEVVLSQEIAVISKSSCNWYVLKIRMDSLSIKGVCYGIRFTEMPGIRRTF